MKLKLIDNIIYTIVFSIISLIIILFLLNESLTKIIVASLTSLYVIYSLYHNRIIEQGDDEKLTSSRSNKDIFSEIILMFILGDVLFTYISSDNNFESAVYISIIAISCFILKKINYISIEK